MSAILVNRQFTSQLEKYLNSKNLIWVMDNDADLEGFKAYLLNEKKLGVRSVRVYLSYYNDFNPLKLSEEYIGKFIIKHKNNSTVRAFMKNYLMYHDVDTEEIKFPKSPTGRKPIRVYREITKKDLIKLREFFYRKGFKYGLIFDIIYQGALRRVEVPSIMLSSFQWNIWLEDMDKHCRLVVLGKGNKEREVLINPETANSLANHYIAKYSWETIEEIESGLNQEVPLFVKPNGLPMTDQNIYDFIKKGSQEVMKSRHIRPHELRSCRATELEDKGIPVNDIKVYLGHSKIATTEVYLHRISKKALADVESKLS